MIRLSKPQILLLHEQLLKATGGSSGLRDEGKAISSYWDGLGLASLRNVRPPGAIEKGTAMLQSLFLCFYSMPMTL